MKTELRKKREVAAALVTMANSKKRVEESAKSSTHGSISVMAG